MRRGGLIGLAAALLCAGASPARAAWTRDPGHGLSITTLTLSTAHGGYDERGHGRAGGDFVKVELQSYLEYGLAEGVTAVVAPTYTHLEIGESGRASGLSKVYLGARLRLLPQERAVLSVQPGVELPGLYRADAVPSLGTGHPIWELRLLYGRSFRAWGVEGFAVAEGTPRLTAGGASQGIEADFTLGAKPMPGLMVLLQSFNKLPLTQAQPPDFTYAEAKIQLSAVREIGGGWSVSAGLCDTYAGRNAAKELAGLLGLWFAF